MQAHGTPESLVSLESRCFEARRASERNLGEFSSVVQAPKGAQSEWIGMLVLAHVI